MTNSNEKTLTARQAARRVTILQTVRSQLNTEGFDAFSMRKVATAAGVSPSTLYEIYGSKESLILYAIGGTLGNLAHEEKQYLPGLDRFLHRLDSIGSAYQNSPDTAEALTKLLFQNSRESPAKEIFLINAVDARKASLEEMLKEKELIKDIDIDFYARALISVTWGTVLFWVKGILPTGNFRHELVRTSLTIILPVTTEKAKDRVLGILNGHRL